MERQREMHDRWMLSGGSREATGEHRTGKDRAIGLSQHSEAALFVLPRKGLCPRTEWRVLTLPCRRRAHVKRREAQGCNISSSKRWGDGVRQRQLDEAKGGQDEGDNDAGKRHHLPNPKGGKCWP